MNFESWLLGDKTGPHCDHCLRHLLAPSLGDTGKFLKYISRFQVSFNFFFFPQLFNLFLTQLALISQPPGTQQSNTLVSNCTYHPLLIISYLWWRVNHDNWFYLTVFHCNLVILASCQVIVSNFSILDYVTNFSILDYVSNFNSRWLSSCLPTACSIPTLLWIPSSMPFSRKTLRRVSER